MKCRLLHRVVLAVVATMLSVGAMAQSPHDGHPADSEVHKPKIRTEWGAGVALSYSMLKPKGDAVTLKPKLGYQGHLQMGLIFTDHIVLETHLTLGGGSVFVKHNAHEDLGHTVRTTTFDIPVLCSLRAMNHRLQLDFGPVFTVRSDGRYTHNGETGFFGQVYPTFNGMVGVTLCLSHCFMLDVAYIFPLGTTHNHFIDPLGEFTMRASRATVGFSVIF